MNLKLLFISQLLVVLTIFPQISSDSSKVDSLLNQAFELRWSNPLESILVSTKALEFSEKINYGTGISKAYGYMGVAYENLSMYDEALKHYFEGLRVADSLNLLEDLGYAYNNIANYYLSLDMFELGLEYLNKCLEVTKKIDSPRLKGYLYRNFSYYHRKKKEFITALEYAEKSLEIRKNLGDERGVITSMREILIIYFNKKDFLNAEVIIKKLYETINSNPKYTLQLARIKITEAELNWQKKNFNLAASLFDESLNLFKSIHNLEGIIRVYKLKAEMLYSIGKFKKAYENIIEHNAYVDSLNKVRSIQKISLIETQFKNKELEDELKLASEELKQRNIILISLFIGFIILGFSFYFNYKANREKRKLINQITEQNKLLEQDNIHKQKLLSIIGHDIKNPLASVYSISEFLIHNSDSIDQDELKNYHNIIHRAVKNSLSLLDNLLIWSMNKMGKLNYNFTDINIKNLIEQSIELYNSSIIEKNLNISIEAKYENVFADKNMLSSILRNLFNNAIKFSPNDGVIKIITEEQDDKILVKVVDNGKGLTQEEIHKILSEDENVLVSSLKKESGTGLGLQIVKDFVKIHNGTLNIKSETNKETEFSFTLPKSKKNHN